jgi:hypothetical protein
MKARLLFVFVLVIQSLVIENTYAQSARSLFSNTSGVTFESNKGEVNTGAPASPASAPTAVKPNAPSNSPKPQQDVTKATQPQKQAKSTTQAQTSTPSESKYSGLSYTLLKQFPNGEVKKVSPSTVFETGDRIRVVLTSNKSGELTVSNINPKGTISLVSEQSVVAGAKVNIPNAGFLKFVGDPGVEQLIFVLAEKRLSKQASGMENPMTTIISSCFQNNTRSLVVDDSAGNQVGLVGNNGNCIPASSAKTRSLVVEVSDNAGYAVMPDSSLADGQMLTLKLNLRHK